MSPEREIVGLWLAKKGFFTVSSISAGSRIIDFLAVRLKEPQKILHVEVSCSVSRNAIENSDELQKLFYDPSVVKSLDQNIEKFLGKSAAYENVLVTNFSDVQIENVSIIKFDDVLFDVLASLDRHKYKSGSVRTLQLLKFLLFSNPKKLSELVNVSLSGSQRESHVKELLQKSGKGVFKKKSNEQLLVDLLKQSSLKNPDRLVAALEEILSKRTGARLLKLLMSKSSIQKAIRTEIKKDKDLGDFLR